MISQKQELITKLKKQVKIEENARDTYKKFVKNINNNKVSRKIKEIINDEIEHIDIAKEMLEIVRKYKKALKLNVGKKENAIKIPIEYSSILIKCKLDDYTKQVVSLLKKTPKNKRIIYVSYNKLVKYIKDLLKENKVDLSRILFISCVPGATGEYMNIEPKDLTRLSIVINEAANKLKDVLVVVDSISAFSTYHSNNIIAEFVASMNQKASKNKYGILWISVSGKEENKLDDIIAPLCDRFIRV